MARRIAPAASERARPAGALRRPRQVKAEFRQDADAARRLQRGTLRVGSFG